MVVNSIAGIVVVLPTIAGLGVVAIGTAAGLEGVVVIAVKWMYILYWKGFNQTMYVQGSAKRWSPGFVNTAGKASQKW